MLYEPLALRVARATVAARATLMAGITTERDLGTEGAGYADVGLRDAVAGGIIPGPRVLAVTRAIVARGSYGVTGAPEWDLPYGAEQVASADEMESVVRDQIGRGADWIKLYGDYRWGPRGRPGRPSPKRSCAGRSRSRPRAGATSPSTRSRRRRCGAPPSPASPPSSTGTRERRRSSSSWPSAGSATARPWPRPTPWRSTGAGSKGTEPEPASVQQSRAAFRAALAAGVAICFGGDVGVFAHGDNVRELEILVRYGMRPADAVVSATSGNARILHLDDLGIRAGGPPRRPDRRGRRSDPGRSLPCATCAS